jgi:D-alanine-D-alanine ligase
MDPSRYDIVPIGISHDGRWYLREDAIKSLKQSAPKLRALGRGGIPVTMAPHPQDHSLEVLRTGRGPNAAANSNNGSSTPGPLDVIFPVLHGTYGEDGTIQGLFELAGIPYVGAGVLGSAIGMDKDTQKRLFRDNGIPVVRYYSLSRADALKDRGLARRLADQLGYPVFVKPNALGSSIGITRVKSATSLTGAINDAFQYDRKVLLEAACEGREFECAVLGNDGPQASVVGEVQVKGRHLFYSYASNCRQVRASASGNFRSLPSKHSACAGWHE